MVGRTPDRDKSAQSVGEGPTDSAELQIVLVSETSQTETHVYQRKRLTALERLRVRAWAPRRIRAASRFEARNSSAGDRGIPTAGGEKYAGGISKSIDTIKVYVYLDTDDGAAIDRVLESTDELIGLLGYDGPSDVRTERGSFIRRSEAKIDHRLEYAEVASRLASLQKLAEQYGNDDKQAQVDKQVAEVFSKLIEAIRDVPEACITAGSTLLLKYQVGGQPKIVGRRLTPREVYALEKHPEIQNEPSKTIAALAMAVERITASEKTPG
jgi:hypothetical protein